jgi:hypothetical protein
VCGIVGEEFGCRRAIVAMEKERRESKSTWGPTSRQSHLDVSTGKSLRSKLAC